MTETKFRRKWRGVGGKGALDVDRHSNLLQ